MSDNNEPKSYQELKGIVDQNPDNPAAWMNLGYYHLDAGDSVRAKKCFLEVLTLDPQDVEAQVNLDRINQVDEPKESILKTIDLEGSDWLETEIPLWLQLAIGLFSFLVIFILARVEKWTAADMVWSLWITSLTIGFGYLFAGVISKALRGADESSLMNRLFQDSIPNGIKFGVLFIGMIFQLVFFTLHFGFFHFVYSIFLNDFFPIMDRSFERFSDFLFFTGISLKAYWPVILFTALASLRKFQRIVNQSEANFAKSAYINVIKIHVSIFLFAGLSTTEMQAWMLAVVFVVYFFPFGAIFEFLKNLKKKPVAT